MKFSDLSDDEKLLLFYYRSANEWGKRTINCIADFVRQEMLLEKENKEKQRSHIKVIGS